MLRRQAIIIIINIDFVHEIRKQLDWFTGPWNKQKTKRVSCFSFIRLNEAILRPEIFGSSFSSYCNRIYADEEWLGLQTCMTWYTLLKSGARSRKQNPTSIWFLQKLTADPERTLILTQTFTLTLVLTLYYNPDRNPLSCRSYTKVAPLIWSW